MKQNLILLLCVVALLATLSYVTKTLLDFHKIAIQVYCEQRLDFDKCSKEFKDKTHKLMRK